jgi:hypothetical protein
MVTALGSVFAGASIGPSFVSFDALRPEIRPFIVVVVVVFFFFGYKKIYRLSSSLSLSHQISALFTSTTVLCSLLWISLILGVFEKNSFPVFAT